MKSNWRTKFKPAQVLLAAGTAFSGIAHAVEDLAGGPTVRQLNMPIGVTEQLRFRNQRMLWPETVAKRNTKFDTDEFGKSVHRHTPSPIYQGSTGDDRGQSPGSSRSGGM